MSELGKAFRSLSVAAAVRGSEEGSAFAFNFLSGAANETIPADASHVIYNNLTSEEKVLLPNKVGVENDLVIQKKKKKKKKRKKGNEVKDDSMDVTTSSPQALTQETGLSSTEPDTSLKSDRKEPPYSHETKSIDKGLSPDVEVNSYMGEMTDRPDSGIKKKRKQKKKKNNNEQQEEPKEVSAKVNHGPSILSHRDPELSEEQKSIRKFGKGINVSAIGPRKALHKDQNWVQHLSHKPRDTNESIVTTISPFTFGFGL